MEDNKNNLKTTVSYLNIKLEDFEDIITLKNNMQFMKNVLNKKMSENLIIIYFSFIFCICMINIFT